MFHPPCETLKLEVIAATQSWKGCASSLFFFFWADWNPDHCIMTETSSHLIFKRLNLSRHLCVNKQVSVKTVVWRTSYTATLVVSWEAVCMLLTECGRSTDFSSRPLLDSLRSSKVIFFGPSSQKHHDGVRKHTQLSSAASERGFILWDSGMLLTFLLSWGLMNVRSSKVRRIRLGPLTSWISWSLLLTDDTEKMKKVHPKTVSVLLVLTDLIFSCFFFPNHIKFLVSPDEKTDNEASDGQSEYDSKNHYDVSNLHTWTREQKTWQFGKMKKTKD